MNEVRMARMAGAQRRPHRKQENRSEHQEWSVPDPQSTHPGTLALLTVLLSLTFS